MQWQSLTTSQRQTNTQPVSKQSPRHALPLPTVFITEHDVTWHRTSLRSVQVSCPSHVPLPAVHPLPAHLLRGTEWGKEKALTLCKQGSATAQSLPCHQHHFSHKSKHSNIYTAVKTVNSTPARLSKERNPKNFTINLHEILHHS